MLQRFMPDCLKRGLILLSALAASAISTVHAASDATVTVEFRAVRSALTANDDVEFQLDFRNNSRRAVRLLKWDIPGETDEGSFFEVKRDGMDVLYIGKHYKRGQPTAADFVVLRPGATLSRKIDLSTQFDFTVTGSYQISYTPHHELPFDRSNLVANKIGAEAVVSPSHSGAVVIWVQGASESLIEKQLLNQYATSPIVMQSVGYAANCSNSQRSSIGSAVNAANNMATESKGYLQGTPTANRASSQRYTTWFGSYTSSNWGIATNHFVAIDDALDSKPLEFDCGCSNSAYAYVYPTQPYKIYLCNAFWSAPMTGTDSKGGTIIHELSHFNVVAGTDDHAYGQTAAKRLAKRSPKKALYNAENHEYFAENTPSLP